MINPFKRKPKFLTLGDAIDRGIVDPAALQQHYVPRSGVSVKTYDAKVNEFGQILLTPKEQTYYPDWQTWRNNNRSIYMGGNGIVEIRDIPTGIREPLIDLSAGVTDVEYEAALGFLKDKGLVNKKASNDG